MATYTGFCALTLTKHADQHDLQTTNRMSVSNAPFSVSRWVSIKFKSDHSDFQVRCSSNRNSHCCLYWNITGMGHLLVDNGHSVRLLHTDGKLAAGRMSRWSRAAVSAAISHLAHTAGLLINHRRRSAILLTGRLFISCRNLFCERRHCRVPLPGCWGFYAAFFRLFVHTCCPSLPCDSSS